MKSRKWVAVRPKGWTLFWVPVSESKRPKSKRAKKRARRSPEAKDPKERWIRTRFGQRVRLVGDITVRESGLLEWTCEHGVGHPLHKSVTWLEAHGPEGAKRTWGIHGCDGCCAHEWWDLTPQVAFGILSLVLERKVAGRTFGAKC